MLTEFVSALNLTKITNSWNKNASHLTLTLVEVWTKIVHAVRGSANLKKKLFWKSIGGCVLNALLKVVNQYDLNMFCPCHWWVSKKELWIGGWVGCALSSFILGFWNVQLAKPLRRMSWWQWLVPTLSHRLSTSPTRTLSCYCSCVSISTIICQTTSQRAPLNSLAGYTATSCARCDWRTRAPRCSATQPWSRATTSRTSGFPRETSSASLARLRLDSSSSSAVASSARRRPSWSWWGSGSEQPSDRRSSLICARRSIASNRRCDHEYFPRH